MGLELVEMVMEMEEAFDISIPDEDAERIRTIRDAIDYVFFRRSDPEAQFCATQRAFYRLRRAVVSGLGAPRAALAPSTRWGGLLPFGRRQSRWKRISDLSGLTLPCPRAEESLGSTARLAIQEFPEQLKPKLERDEVARIVRAVTAKVFETTSFSDDTRFVDLGG